MPHIAELLEEIPEWIEQAPYAVGVRDETSRIVYLNRAALDLFGGPPDQLLGSPLSAFIDPSHADRVDEELEARRRGETDPYVLKCRLPGAPEEPVPLLILPQPIRGGDGEMLGSMAVVITLPGPSRAPEGPTDWRISDGARELLNRVGELVRRRTAFSLDLLRQSEPRAAALSEREWEILTLLARGARVRNVAARLELSQNTVRSHLKSIFRKLDVSSQAELVDWVERAMSRARAGFAEKP